MCDLSFYPLKAHLAMYHIPTFFWNPMEFCNNLTQHQLFLAQHTIPLSAPRECNTYHWNIVISTLHATFKFRFKVWVLFRLKIENVSKKNSRIWETVWQKYLWYCLLFSMSVYVNVFNFTHLCKPVWLKVLNNQLPICINWSNLKFCHIWSKIVSWCFSSNLI